MPCPCAGLNFSRRQVLFKPPSIFCSTETPACLLWSERSAILCYVMFCCIPLRYVLSRYGMVCYIILCSYCIIKINCNIILFIGGRPLDQSWAAAVPLGRRAHLPARRGAVSGVFAGGCGGHRQESGVHRAPAKHGPGILQHKHEARPHTCCGYMHWWKFADFQGVFEICCSNLGPVLK